MQFGKKRNDWQRPLLVGLAIGLLCAAGMALGLLSTWSHRLTDRLFTSQAPDARVAIIAIDDAAMARLGRWPWPRAVHAQVIDKISQAKPLAIGYDVNFPETSDQENDKALADSLRQAGNVVLPIELTLIAKNSKLFYDPARVLTPIPLIASAAARLGHTNTPQDPDGVVRRVPIWVFSDKPSDQVVLPAFTLQIAEIAGLNLDPKSVVDGQNKLIVHYINSPKHSFPTYSAADLIDGKVKPEQLAGRFVLVGSTAPDLHDEQLVPTSVTQPMPGIEIHASLLDTLLKKDYLREVPIALSIFWLILIGAILGFLVPKLKARWAIPLAVGLWIITIATSFVLFDRGWIADLLWPTIAILFGFGAVMLERRIAAEYQKREIRNAFSRYVTESVVESILSDPSKLKLGGERRKMTVLFSDIRGFTSISEGLNPEKLVEIMNKYLSRMTAEVFKHEGVLDKYIGDAVMAFWNAPFDQPDHAKRAVETALDMLSALKEMNANKAFGDVELKIGVGVNTGEMVVGNMGSEERFDYTVIGDSVNLGSRLESLTKEYGVCLLITESARQELNNGYLIRQVDLVAVKGKKEPVKIFEVMKRNKNASQADKQFIKKFEDALAAYFAKDFAQAVQLTSELLSERPEDGPSKTLKARSDHFLQEPPPGDWNGVWVMTKK
ncbi:MAG: adenylate/guanylate cyclase domain-containing protein [Patescibacteria group bacterium]|nr:adenylate/guanylate cyclase domain-containing protein [Patescibacteria group bacterium]